MSKHRRNPRHFNMCIGDIISRVSGWDKFWVDCGDFRIPCGVRQAPDGRITFSTYALSWLFHQYQRIPCSDDHVISAEEAEVILGHSIYAQVCMNGAPRRELRRALASHGISCIPENWEDP